jgi:ABC-2 type transport system ATP-binding protein
MALAKRPELLLLDEPVARLDPLARRVFLQTLMQAVVDLERVCDFLVLLMAAEVRVTGAIDDLLAEHKLLTGPSGGSGRIAGVTEIVSTEHSPRQSTVVARLGGPVADPAWSVEDIGLEELLLAYMGSARARPPDVAAPPRIAELHAL